METRNHGKIQKRSLLSSPLVPWRAPFYLFVLVGTGSHWSPSDLLTEPHLPPHHVPPHWIVTSKDRLFLGSRKSPTLSTTWHWFKDIRISNEFTTS